jgi:hypothetical protein
MSAANAIPLTLFLHPGTRIWLPIAIAGFLVSIALAYSGSRRRQAWLYDCVLIAGLILMGAGTPSCGGGGGSSPPITSTGNNGTTPGSYSVTVYAFTESNTSDGSNSHADASVAIPLTVN